MYLHSLRADTYEQTKMKTLGCAFGHLFQKRTWGTNYRDSRADINRLATGQGHGKKFRKLTTRMFGWEIVWEQSVMRSMSHTNGDEKGHLQVKTLIPPPTGSIGGWWIPAASFFQHYSSSWERTHPRTIPLSRGSPHPVTSRCSGKASPFISI